MYYPEDTTILQDLKGITNIFQDVGYRKPRK